MRPKSTQHFRRRCNPERFTEDLVSVEPRKNLRQILDSMLKGNGMDTTIRKHEPLLPDGENPDDFESGTQEILDLVDQQHLEEQIQEFLDSSAKQQKAQTEAQQKAAFDKAVEDEIARRTNTTEQA